MLTPDYSKVSTKIRQQAQASFESLLALIRAGKSPRDAVAEVMATFNGRYVEALSKAFTALLGEFMGPLEVRALPVGKVKLSTLLYANAKQVSAQVQRIVKEHAAGFHDARKLAKTLYQGYDFGPDVLKIAKGLPKYLQKEFAKFQAASLKTPALRAAYLQAVKAIEDGKGFKELEKQLKVAVYERNRYFANRIAQTELHRTYTDQQALDLMGQDRVKYVQIRLSGRHTAKDTDICDLHAGLNKYGLGPGVYPKAAAPNPPYHPFCRCVCAVRADLSANDSLVPKEKPDAERLFLQRLKVDEAAKVMGGRAKLQQVLDGKDWESVINANKDKLYHLQRVGDILPAKMATAFDTAKAGGPHFGLWKNYQDRPVAMLERAVKSLDQRVSEHRGKIAGPHAYLRPDIPERQIEHLVNIKWPEEIAIFKVQIEILNAMIEEKRRG